MSRILYRHLAESAKVVLIQGPDHIRPALFCRNGMHQIMHSSALGRLGGSLFERGNDFISGQLDVLQPRMNLPDDLFCRAHGKTRMPIGSTWVDDLKTAPGESGKGLQQRMRTGQARNFCHPSPGIKPDDGRRVPINLHWDCSRSARMDLTMLSSVITPILGASVTGSKSSKSRTWQFSSSSFRPRISPSSIRQSTWSPGDRPAASQTSTGRVVCSWSRIIVALTLLLSHRDRGLSRHGIVFRRLLVAGRRLDGANTCLGGGKSVRCFFRLHFGQGELVGGDGGQAGVGCQ